MGRHTTADVRNIALVGAPGTGKTALAEAILHHCGAIARLGSVAEGTTTSDWEEDEQHKQHSLRLSLLHAEWKGSLFHILDAPGYPDYVGEAACALGAVEVAALVVNAHVGLTFPGRRAWDMTGRRGRARCIVVTHIDQQATDLLALSAEMSERLGARCLPVTVIEGGRVLSLPLDGSAAGTLKAPADAVIEAAVESDDAALARFLEEDHAPPADETAALLRHALLTGSVVPVLAVCPTTGLGVGELLDFARRVLPSPADGPFYRTVEGDEVRPDSPGTTLFAFKTLSDAFVGKLCLLRVVCGSVKPGATLKLARTGKGEKLAHLQRLQGKGHAEIPEAVAGDLIAVGKIEDVEISDTLHDPGSVRVLQPLRLPKTMASLAVQPSNHADELKLSTAMRRAAAEDPSFTYERNGSTGELVAHGISRMHLETVLHRIKERSGVEVKVAVPRVPLKETITAAAEGHHRHKKQTGGRGQFAEVFLSVEPAARGQGLDFVDDTVGGSIPRNFLPAIEKGVLDSMAKGIIAGYPVVDVTVRVKDGKHHDVDSDEASFKIAGARAFKDAFRKARPVLLEPLYDLEIAVPARFMGAIASDLTTRRGHINGMDMLGDMQIVKTRVPQREVMTYPTVLNSLTAGEGSFTADFHDYDVVPGSVQQQIMAEFKPHDDD